MFTSHISGSGRAIGPVCVFVCLSVSFNLYLPRWFASTLSMSSLKVKIIGQRSWSEEELMLLKWSLRSEVRAF